MSSDDFNGMCWVSGVLLLPFFYGLYLCLRIRQTWTWPETKGVITQSDMKITPTAKGGKSYEPLVTYRYNVGGVEYSSSKVKIIGVVVGIKPASEYTLSQYPLGRTTLVYYNPAKPKDAVLEKSSAMTCAVYMALDLMVIAFIWILVSHPGRPG